jgi:hypothetical protein
VEVRGAEQRVGEIVVRFAEEEGLTLHEVVDWCQGKTTFADVARMPRAATLRAARATEDRGRQPGQDAPAAAARPFTITRNHAHAHIASARSVHAEGQKR